MRTLVNHLLVVQILYAEYKVTAQFAHVCPITLDVRRIVDLNVSSTLNVHCNRHV